MFVLGGVELELKSLSVPCNLTSITSKRAVPSWLHCHVRHKEGNKMFDFPARPEPGGGGGSQLVSIRFQLA